MKTHEACLELRLHDPCEMLDDEPVATFRLDNEGQRRCQQVVEYFRVMAESHKDVYDNLIVVRTHVTTLSSESEATT